MDNRFEARRGRGNAFYADSARAALGLRSDVHALSDVPLPFVHTALGVAVCSVVVALRPQQVGLRNSVIAAGALALGSALTLALYDRFVYQRGLRHALAAMALPIAAIAGFVVVLTASGNLGLRLPAGALTALVIGGIPHLGGLRAAGREGVATRLLRDGAGILVLAPILLAAYSGAVALWSSAALAGCGVLLVTFDALLTETMAARLAVAGAVLAGGLFAALVLVLPAAGRGTVRAALLLVLWYGVRGVVGSLPQAGRHRLALTAEYAVFVVAAAGGLTYGVVS
ncbi:MAG: hypothetical protein M3R48_03555 [Candidatus Dormibacteraeota bacterium]|nr:hypothetical protein [Candidatus Dormibacteraeota bacterium]